MTDKFERLNRETWKHNNIGNHHHHSNTGINHKGHQNTFTRLNAQTYWENNYKQNLFRY